MKTHRTGPRTIYIKVRVTPLEFDEIDAHAKKEGISISDLVRKTTFKRIKNDAL